MVRHSLTAAKICAASLLAPNLVPVQPVGPDRAGVRVRDACGKYGGMVDQEGERNSILDSQEWLARAPKVSDALKKGAFVSIATWSGREIVGLVCDREQSGLLLDIREPDADSEGYVFMP